MQHPTFISLLFISTIASAEPLQKVIEVATMIEAHEVGGLEFSADASQLVIMAGAYDRQANVWNWRKASEVATLPDADASPMVSVSGRISPNGRFFVHCGWVVTVWETSTWKTLLALDGQTAKSRESTTWPGNCKSIEFSPDGRTLVVLRNKALERGGPTVSAYDTSTWSKRWTIETTVFYPKNVAFRPDGKELAVAGRVNNVKSGPGHATFPTFGDPPLPDTGLIAVLDMDKQEFVRMLKVPETNYASSQTVAWQGKQNVLSYGAAHAIRTFDASSGSPLDVTPTEGLYGRPAVFLSPNGRVQLETGFGREGELIRVVNVAGGTRTVVREIRAKVRSVAWSRDSRYFALGGAALSIGSLSPLLELIAPSKGKAIVYELR